MMMHGPFPTPDEIRPALQTFYTEAHRYEQTGLDVDCQEADLAATQLESTLRANLGMYVDANEAITFEQAIQNEQRFVDVIFENGDYIEFNLDTNTYEVEHEPNF